MTASAPGAAPTPLKYAVVERERRFLLRAMPEGVTERVRIADRYLDDTRLRLREMWWDDGRVVRKLGHKVRLGEGPREVACTSVYLDDAEWALLTTLPGHEVRKVRHHVRREGWHVVVDELGDGTLLAEIDDGETPDTLVPSWLDIVADVTDDEDWTGAALARREAPGPGGGRA